METTTKITTNINSRRLTLAAAPAVDDVEAVGMLVARDEGSDDVTVVLEEGDEAVVELRYVPGEVGHTGQHTRGDVARQQHLGDEKRGR